MKKSIKMRTGSAARIAKRIAVYPGSFDPITLGHLDIVHRISKQFDRIVVLVAESPEKKGLFSVEERLVFIRRSLKRIDNVQVDSHVGLTVDYARQVGAKVIVRGLRAVVDFEYEIGMANLNHGLAPDIETMLVFARPEFYFISSRAVKEIARWNGEIQKLVPAAIAKQVVARLQS